MCQIIKERNDKLSRILEEYGKRKSHNDIAKMFHMNAEDVGIVTRMNGYSHTRKVPTMNSEKEADSSDQDLDQYAFLDQYPIENFLKYPSTQ